MLPLALSTETAGCVEGSLTQQLGNDHCPTADMTARWRTGCQTGLIVCVCLILPAPSLPRRLTLKARHFSALCRFSAATCWASLSNVEATCAFFLSIWSSIFVTGTKNMLAHSADPVQSCRHHSSHKRSSQSCTVAGLKAHKRQESGSEILTVSGTALTSSSSPSLSRSMYSRTGLRGPS